MFGGSPFASVPFAQLSIASAINLIAAEAAAATDAANRTLAASLAISESGAANSAQSVAVFASAAEAAAAGHQQSVTLAAFLAMVEATTALDTANRTLSPALSQTESASASETSNRTASIARVQAEPATGVDTPSVVLMYAIANQQEPASATDTEVGFVVYPASGADAGSAADASSAVPGYNRIIQSYAPIVDATSATMAAPAAQTEAGSAADASSQALTKSSAQAETGAASDTSNRTMASAAAQTETTGHSNQVVNSRFDGTVGSLPTGYSTTGTSASASIATDQTGLPYAVGQAVAIRRTSTGFMGMQRNYGTPLVAGRTYSFAISIRTVDGVNPTTCGLYLTVGAPNTVTVASQATLQAQTTGTWVRYKVTFTCTTGTPTFSFISLGGSNGEGFDIMAPQLDEEAVAGPYIPTTNAGSVTLSAVDEATLAIGAARVEPATAADALAVVLMYSTADRQELASAVHTQVALNVASVMRAEPTTAVEAQDSLVNLDRLIMSYAPIVDTTDVTMASTAAQTDTGTAADAPNRTLTAPASETEAASATDSPNRTKSATAAGAESASASDSSNRTNAAASAQAESASATDTESTSSLNTQTDAGAAADAPASSTTANRAQTDSASATETESVASAASRVEPATATDAPAVVSMYSIANRQEPASATDTAVEVMVSTVARAEPTTATETSATSVNLDRLIMSYAPIDDTTSSALTVASSTTDTGTSTDTTSASMASARTVSELYARTLDGSVSGQAGAYPQYSAGHVLAFQRTQTTSTTSTYFDAAGVLQTATANTPRFAYNPSTVRTNYLLHSNLKTGTSAYYSLSGAVVTDSGVDLTATDPFGGTGARKFTVTGSGSLRFATGGSHLVAGVNNSPFAGSVYIMSADGVSRSISCDLNDLNIASFTVGATWKRIGTTAQRQGVDYRFLDINLVAGTYYMYGCQIEPGLTITDYIPTTTAPVSVGGTYLGLLIEDSEINYVPNNTMVGAVANTSMPTGWSAGLWTCVGVGVENGIEYVDVRINRTNVSGATEYGGITMVSGVSAAPGEVWTCSAYIRQIAGTTTGLTWGGAEGLRVAEAGTANVFSGVNPLNVGNGPLNKSRLTRTLTIAATTTAIQLNFQLPIPAGNTVDCTFRIGLPQLEKSSSATSVVKTAGTINTRGADVASLSAADLTAASLTASVADAEASAAAETANRVLTISSVRAEPTTAIDTQAVAQMYAIANRQEPASATDTAVEVVLATVSQSDAGTAADAGVGSTFYDRVIMSYAPITDSSDVSMSTANVAQLDSGAATDTESSHTLKSQTDTGAAADTPAGATSSTASRAEPAAANHTQSVAAVGTRVEPAAAADAPVVALMYSIANRQEPAAATETETALMVAAVSRAEPTSATSAEVGSTFYDRIIQSYAPLNDTTSAQMSSTASDVEYSNQLTTPGLYPQYNAGHILAFQRLTTGTYFDTAGTLQTAAVNTARFTQDPTTLHTNLLFPSSPNNTNWTPHTTNGVPNYGVAPDGNTTTYFTQSATPHRYKGVVTVAGNAYTYSYYVRCAATDSIRIYVDGNIGSGSTFSSATGLFANTGAVPTLSGLASAATCTPGTGAYFGWYRVTLTFTPLGGTQTNCHVYPNSSNPEEYWGHQVELGTSADTLIQTTTSTVTQSDSYGLLIEEARTNSYLRSADLKHSAWTKTNTTVADSSVLMPDGSAMTRLTAGAAFASHWQLVAVTAGDIRTETVYAKYVDIARMTLVQEGTGSWRATFDLSAGTVVGYTTVGSISGGLQSVPTISHIGNGIYRCRITYMIPTGMVNCQLKVWIGDYSGTNNAGLSVDIAWRQSELGDYETSFIPTTTAPVTRDADTAFLVVTDSPSASNQMPVVRAEPASATETENVSKTASAARVEPAAATDAPNRTMTASRSQTDTGAASDSESVSAVANAEGLLGRTVAQFTAGQGYVRVNDSPSLQFVNSLSIEFRVKGTVGSTPWQRLLTKASGSSADAGWMVYHNNLTPNVGIRLDTAGTGGVINQNKVEAPNVLDGTEHHMVFTINGSTVTSFKDGVLAVSQSFVAGTGFNTTFPLRVAANENGLTVFNGQVYDVRIYARVLTNTEIAEHAANIYNDNTALAIYLPLMGDTEDYSGNGNDGTATGTIGWVYEPDIYGPAQETESATVSSTRTASEAGSANNTQNVAAQATRTEPATAAHVQAVTQMYAIAADVEAASATDTIVEVVLATVTQSDAGAGTSTEVGSTFYDRLIQSYAPIVDAMDRTLTAPAAEAEPAAAVDVPSVAVRQSRAEPTTALDTTDVVAGLAVSRTEAAAAAEVESSITQKTQAEPATGVDTPSVFLMYAIAARQEPASATDTETSLMVASVARLEPTAASETQDRVAGFDRLIQSYAPIDDSTSATMTSSAVEAESASAADTPSVAATRSQTDSGSGSDSSSSVTSAAVARAEPASATDTETATSLKSQTDTSAAVDAPVVALMYSIANRQEPASATETESILMVAAVTRTEATTATETQDRLASIDRIIQSYAPIDDTTSATVAATASDAEAASATDSESASATLPAARTELTLATDTQNRVPSLALARTEPTTATEVQAVAGMYATRVQNDSGAATDTEATLMVSTAAVVEYGTTLLAPGLYSQYSAAMLLAFQRPTDGTYFDGSGNLQVAAPMAPRFQGGALLIENGSTNVIRNNSMVGAASGTPGTLPTNWQGALGTVNGVSVRISAISSENGIPYFDLEFSGTPTVDTVLFYNPDNLGRTDAAIGQTWTSSIYTKKVSGTIPSALFYVSGRTAGGSDNGDNSSTPMNVGTGALSAQRVSVSRTLSTAGTAKVGAFLRFGLTNGVLYLFTIRIGSPQLEFGASATSLIQTTNADGVRGADLAWLFPTETESSAMVAARTADSYAPITDTASVAALKSQIDSGSSTESASVIVPVSRTEPATATDSPNRTMTASASRAEPTSAVDSQNRSIGLNPALDEPVSAQDFPTVTQMYAIAAEAEPASATDTEVAIVLSNVNQTDTGAGADSTNRSVTLDRVIMSYAPIVDTPTATKSASASRAESTSATDTPVLALMYATANRQEPASATDTETALAIATATQTDSGAGADAPTGTVNIDRIIMSYAPIVDTPAVALMYAIANRQEPASATDTETVLSVAARSQTEAGAGTDTSSSVPTFDRLIQSYTPAAETSDGARTGYTAQAEPASAADVPAVALMYSTASRQEPASATDTETALTLAIVSRTEPVSATDTSTRLVTIDRLIMSYAPIIDTPAVALMYATASRQEPASATDTETALNVSTVSRTETGAATDTTTGVPTFDRLIQSYTPAVETQSVSPTMQATQTDSGSATDLQDPPLVTRLVSASEGTLSTDASTGQTFVAASEVDVAVATETQNKSMPVSSSQSDTASATETESVSSTASASATESTTATNTQSQQTSVSTGATDSTPITDTASQATGISVTRTEPATATDTPTGTMNVPVTRAESTTPTDTQSQQTSVTRTQTDAGSAQDVPSTATQNSVAESTTPTDVAISAQAADANVSEVSVTPSEVTNRSLTIIRSQQDVASAFDVTSVAGLLQATQADVNAIIDKATVIDVAMSASITESGIAADLVNGMVTKLAAALDGTSATDLQAVAVTILRALQEANPATDLASAVAAAAVTVAEGANAKDLVGIAISRSQTDAGGATDTSQVFLFNSEKMLMLFDPDCHC